MTGDEYKRMKKHLQIRKPKFIKAPSVHTENYYKIKKRLKSLNLSTVCQEAKCPNIGECWGGQEGEKSTATIMLMGDTCTRACRFCSVKTSNKPPPLDPNEPKNTALAVSEWGIDYIVLTSVDRDDLMDFGAAHIAETVAEIVKQSEDKIMVEALVPDFNGDTECIKLVANSGLKVFAHNIETVEELTHYVRDRRAFYRQSLSVLKRAKEINPKLLTKSSIMLGCGETEEQVITAMQDLRNNNVDILTLGQYLQPTKGHMKISRYLAESEFEAYKTMGDEMGFKYVASGPMVRSSYRAAEVYIKSLVNNNRNSSNNIRL